MIRDFLRDLSGYSIGITVSAIIEIIALPIITHLFSPENYGNYVLVITATSALSVIGGWLSISIVRFYPSCEQEGKLPEFYGEIIRWVTISVVILSLIYIGILVSIKNIISYQLYRLLLIGTLVFISITYFEVIRSILRAKRLVTWYVGLSAFKSIVSFGLGISLVIIFKYNIDGLLWGIIMAQLFAIFLLWKVPKGNITISYRSYSGLIKDMAKFSIPMVVANLATWILSQSDLYVLELFHTSNDVGIYAINYKVAESSIFLLTSLFAFAFNPLAIIIWEKKGEEASKDFLYKGTRYFFLLCLPAVVGISVLREPIIHVLVAPEYYDGVKVIPLVALGIFLLGIQERFGAGLSFLKKTYLHMCCIVIAGLINLGLNFILIPSYGYMAAAFTTLFSYAFLLILMIFVSRRFYVWKFPFKSIKKISLASIVMGIILHFTNKIAMIDYSPVLKLILCIFIGTAVYVFMLFVLRAFLPEELKALSTFKKKLRNR